MTRILCIDDHRDTLELRKRVLVFEIFRADCAEWLRRTQTAGRAKVDLVVLDYLMPGMDGDKVVKTLSTEFPLTCR